MRASRRILLGVLAVFFVSMGIFAWFLLHGPKKVEWHAKLGLGGSTAMTVEGDKIDYNHLYDLQRSFQNSDNQNGKTLAQSIADAPGEANDEVILNKALLAVAKQHNVTVTQDDIDKELAFGYSQLGGKDQFYRIMESKGQSREFLTLINENNILKARLAQYVFSTKAISLMMIRYDYFGFKDDNEAAQYGLKASAKLQNQFGAALQKHASYDDLAKLSDAYKAGQPNPSDKGLLAFIKDRNLLYTQAAKVANYVPGGKTFDESNPPHDSVSMESQVDQLKNPGDYSKPFKSPSGFYAIVRLEAVGNGSQINTWQDFLKQYKQSHNLAALIDIKYAKKSIAELFAPEAFADDCSSHPYTYSFHAQNKSTGAAVSGVTISGSRPSTQCSPSSYSNSTDGAGNSIDGLNCEGSNYYSQVGVPSGFQAFNYKDHSNYSGQYSVYDTDNGDGNSFWLDWGQGGGGPINSTTAYLTILITPSGPVNPPPPPPPPPVSGVPDGYVDGADCSHIYGWAQDGSNPSAQLRVDIYVGGPTNTPGIVAISITANGARGDSKSGHGFDVSPGGRSGAVYAYGFDANGNPYNLHNQGVYSVPSNCGVNPPPPPPPPVGPPPPPPPNPTISGTVTCTGASGTFQNTSSPQITVNIQLDQGYPTSINTASPWSYSFQSQLLGQHNWTISSAQVTNTVSGSINCGSQTTIDSGFYNVDCTHATGYASEHIVNPPFPDQYPQMKVVLTFDVPYGSPGLSEGTNQFTIDANSTISPSSHPQHEFDFTIPAAFKDTSGHTIYGYAIDPSNSNSVAFTNSPIGFGPCVAKTWNLDLQIVSTNVAGGTYDNPGSVDPGQNINLEAIITNTGNGDSPQYMFNGYNPTIDTETPTDKNGNMFTQGPNPGIAAGSGPTLIFYGPFNVPSSGPGAVDGTEYCFGGDVQPGAGNSFGVISSPKHVWDPLSDHTKQTCFKIVTTRYPYLTTSYGDIHAGGGLNLGVACAQDDPNPANPLTPNADQILGSSKHNIDVSYVASAGGNIQGVGGPSSLYPSSVELGNGGNYGRVCRPDLVTPAQQAVQNGDPTVVTVPAPCNLGSLVSGSTGVETILYYDSGICGAGDAVLPAAAIKGRVTLYAPHNNVRITGDIQFVGTSGVNNLPAFGIVTGGDINIDPIVSNLDGYYYALGNVDTCYGIDIHANADACSNQLTLYGLMMAHGYRFARTGQAHFNGAIASEIFNFIGDVYVAPPPVFKDIISQRAAHPRYSSELPPLY